MQLHLLWQQRSHGEIDAILKHSRAKCATQDSLSRIRHLQLQVHKRLLTASHSVLARRKHVPSLQLSPLRADARRYEPIGGWQREVLLPARSTISDTAEGLELA